MDIKHGDCLDKMKEIEENSIDTIITDPPYGLSFMGKKWDYDVPSVEVFKEMLRVAKPGATLMCFAGSRTQHRMAVNVEDAGWILKDCIMWLYGSGFPKATDISKQLDKGHERKVVGKGTAGKGFNKVKGFGENTTKGGETTSEWDVTEPSTQEAKLWNGWKSHGLKPAYEPILVAMKPNEGTYANNALTWGVSGLNIDGGRIDYESEEDKASATPQGKVTSGTDERIGAKPSVENKERKEFNRPEQLGRFPANIILDEEAGKMLDEQSGERKGFNGFKKDYKTKCNWDLVVQGRPVLKAQPGYKDSGGASRFFYCAKASKAERNAGCEGLEEKSGAKQFNEGMEGKIRSDGTIIKNAPVQTNHHPTVKPLKLMEYLCILTKTPTGGVVLDPFMGSGTTGIACQNTGRDFIGIEMDAEYIEIAKARLNSQPNTLF